MTTRRRGQTISLPLSMFAVAVVVLLPLPASAHSELVDSTPKANSLLNRAPTDVELVFNEPIQEQGSSIEVSWNGSVLEEASFKVRDTTASTVLIGDLGAGTYQVAYRIVSEDGHVVRDSFTYEVAAGSSATASPHASDQSSTATTPLSSEESDESTGTAVWVLGAGAIGLALVAALIAVMARGRRGRSN